MTTLEAIGYTTAGCGSIAAFTFAFFAVAVRTRSCNIAPRCTARSKDTIYNPKAKRGKRSFFLFGRNDVDGQRLKKGERGKDGFVEHDDEDDTSVDSEKKTREEVQYRGGPMFGWIPWTLSISYDQLLRGVPGTGTRKGGMEGSLLRVNLDGIILLRFHALCLRVSILATIIGIALILPLNVTARCFSLSEDDTIAPQCNSTDYNITNYEQTTLANIPSLDAGSGDGVSWLYGWFGSSVSIFGSKFSSYLGRLYAVVGFSWVLVFYTLHLMKKEWVDALALRRVYYLEGFHWENRIAELQQTVLNYESDSSEDGEDMKPGAMAKRRAINNRKRGNRTNKRKNKRRSKDAMKRDPWIPHPEQRETVPNIELYSVLVGNIPSLPSEVAAEGDLESMGFSRSECLDWQLAVTAAFFDQCVPNQPGFSSSVAAVTILPDAPKLAKAWRAWYKHVGLLRRLRYVRALIAKKRYYEIDEVGEEEDDEESNGSDVIAGTNAPLGDGKSLDVLFPLDQSSSSSKEEDKKNESGGHLFQDNEIEDHLDVSPDALNGSSGEYSDMKLLQHRINYYKDVFGADIDADGGLELEKTLIMHALEYGPEQTAVYSREFAQGAAACCPNGCREERLHYYELKDLEILEEEITDALVQSFEDLINAQKSNVDNNEDNKKGKGQNQLSSLNGVPSPTIQNAGSMEDIKLPPKYDTESRLLSRTPKKYIPKGYKESERDNNLHDKTDFVTRTSNNEQSQHIGDHDSPVDRSLQLTNKLSSSLSHREEFQSRITLSNQGRVYFKESTVFGPRVGSVHGGSFGSYSSQGPQPYNRDIMSKRSEWVNDINQNGLRTRQRVNTGMSQMSSGIDTIGQWEKVQQIIHDDEVAKGVSASDHRHAFSGVWKIPTVSSIIRKFCEKVKSMRNRTKHVVEDFASDSTFAVVTFTSRQAAIAARHCLADGRGADRWIPVEDIPVPPLADAAAGDLKTCRGCCRPVTLTVNPKQQFVRKYTAMFMLATIFVFYTVPLTLVANLAAPENIKKVIPVLAELANVNPFVDRLLQGFVPALLNSLFFSLCPVMFKAISNFGSNAISVNQAEYNALQYYWAFMVVTAFSGTSLAQIGLAYLGGKQAEGNTFTTILVFVAGRLPGQVSANWMNWIILRSLVILPLQYMLQVNTFIFQWLGWKCCRRCVMGGGPGGPVPYRIYIDSGVVFMCIVALSPVSPLVAPASMLYFLYCAPLWRRNCIYIYRPKFDTGGLRWPFLSDILISSLCVGQVLLTTAMALKEAVGPAILSAFPIIPVLVHRRFNRKRYLKSYVDCALLQTSQLDGWDNDVPTSVEKREEYRKFLVDAHKAAYVPICIASSTTATKLTAEPAVVVKHKNDVLQPVPLSDGNATLGYHSDLERDGRNANGTDRSLGYAAVATAATTPTMARSLFMERAKPQYFASYRRLKQSTFIDQGTVGSESFGIGD